ncbi:MAG: hypothetical protein ABF649_07940 [Bacillus sp. (in: firmicutes)]
MTIYENNQACFVVFIPFATIKRFFIMDMVIGTVAFYFFKIMCNHILLDSIASMAVTETMKRIQKHLFK